MASHRAIRYIFFHHCLAKKGCHCYRFCKRNVNTSIAKSSVCLGVLLMRLPRRVAPRNDERNVITSIAKSSVCWGVLLMRLPCRVTPGNDAVFKEILMSARRIAVAAFVKFPYKILQNYNGKPGCHFWQLAQIQISLVVPRLWKCVRMQFLRRWCLKLQWWWKR